MCVFSFSFAFFIASSDSLNRLLQINMSHDVAGLSVQFLGGMQREAAFTSVRSTHPAEHHMCENRADECLLFNQSRRRRRARVT